MTPAEHIKQAREFLEQSERELRDGDELQASEKLWGAATHAILSVMLAEGVRSRKHRDLKNAVNRLAVVRGDPAIYAGFAIAEKFHSNFYNGFMEDYEIESDKYRVHDFVERVLTDTPPGVVEPAPPRI